MVEDLEGQTKKIHSNCFELVYFMRGAVSYSEMLDMTPKERKIMSEFLEKRMEIEGKRQNPIY